ncbi:hypothetical protein Poli38472_000513 [Pythium oligandrum]|uniref:Bidirectional sugar transporter SWEET n=1 Tax=Pythium oligandrum TaxID=41045 RepID=A0A8K1CBV8_PYTOL|nr:hypothetical protein Poli38472_000513 [Pythium oligandrum]|eukprot:TMW60471.1 hypothetical protein Poli38472_000513 [Pythium oligandrum]
MGVALDILRVITSCTTIMLILSPTPDIYRIHKTRQCGHTSIIPLVSILGNCHMWMMYGYLERNYFPVFATYLVGNVMAIIYMTVYYRATEERVYVRKVILGFVAFLLAASVYVILGVHGVTHQTREQVTKTTGYIAIAVSLVLFASPFEKTLEVFRYRSAVFLPINMVVASTINNSMWVVYAVIDYDVFLFAPNAVVVGFGLIQMALYFAFHPKTHPLVLSREDELTSKVSDVEAGSVSIEYREDSTYRIIPPSPMTKESGTQ